MYSPCGSLNAFQTPLNGWTGSWDNGASLAYPLNVGWNGVHLAGNWGHRALLSSPFTSTLNIASVASPLLSRWSDASFAFPLGINRNFSAPCSGFNRSLGF